MGLFNKLKNLLFEEVEEVKNETLKEEMTTSKPNVNPVVETKISCPKDDMEDIISERELFKSETTFKFPVIFEDDDFIEEKKINKNRNALDFETIKIREQQQKENIEPKKAFKVSPIISPVYGILDKNYKKEDITKKDKDEPIPVFKDEIIDFDVVRKKAYGTLEDELEQVLEPEDDNKGMFFNLKAEEEKPDLDDTNLLYDMSEKGEQCIVDDITLGAAEDNYADFGLEYSVDRKIKDVAEINDDNLFDLIDSMYENKEE